MPGQQGAAGQEEIVQRRRACHGVLGRGGRGPVQDQQHDAAGKLVHVGQIGGLGDVPVAASSGTGGAGQFGVGPQGHDDVAGAAVELDDHGRETPGEHGRGRLREFRCGGTCQMPHRDRHGWQAGAVAGVGPVRWFEVVRRVKDIHAHAWPNRGR